MTENLHTLAGASPSTGEPPTIFCRRTAIFGAMALAAAPLTALPAAAFAPVAARAVADAALIDFAGRTIALAQRQERVASRRADAEAVIDNWHFANRPDEPEVPKTRSRMVATEFSTATHRIMQFSEPLEDVDQTKGEAELLTYKEARKLHERAVADKMAQSRVPYLIKLSDRMWQRLIRSVELLTDMQPSTIAGLAAKASVIEALAVTDSELADHWGQNLFRSIAEDAMRLHASSVQS